MYAVVEVAGNQIKVEKGEKFKTPKLGIDEGESFEIKDVLLLCTDDEVKIGEPLLDGVKVKATVLAHAKADKIIVFKMKRRKGYRRKNGHRQEFTEIVIDDIELADSKQTKAKAEPQVT